jgi:CheY-like chemotaxis protein
VKTILIADDEPNMRLLVCATIASDQYTVLEAADGDQAWELIQQHRPSVALLDVQMPGRSGLELVRAIKADPLLRATYVILLTALSMEADVAEGLQAGADLYLTKPFSPLELLGAVERALGFA